MATSAVESAQNWWKAHAERVLGVEAAKAPPPEIFWALADGQTYKAAWTEASELLAARKLVRHFDARYEPAPKLCQVSGRFPALERGPKGLWNPKGDRLGAEGWLKRVQI